MSAPDRPRVVTIFGERGTGKSTILLFALRELARSDDFHVLPVIDPDGFARGDSLGGWVLAHLYRSLSDAERAHLLSTGQTLTGRIEELSRIQAVRSGDFLPGLERRGLTYEDFARDAVKVPYRNIAMGEEWADLVDVLAAAKGQNKLQLVISIDDADMSPEVLPSIVKDAQTLGASPRVVIFFAAARATLRQALEVGLIADHGPSASDALAHHLLSPRDVRSLVERRLVKNFPRSLRVTLPPLGPERRIDFTPLGHTKSISDLLGDLPIAAPNVDTLRDLFVIRDASGETLEPSEYANALSDNPRDLRQLHEALEGEAASVEIAPDLKVGSRALGHILAQGYEAVEDSFPTSLDQPWAVERIDPVPRVSFRLRDIVFGKAQGSGSLIYRPPDAGPGPLMTNSALAVRPDDGHYSGYGPEPDSGEGSESDPDKPRERERLSPQFTYLTHLAWDGIQEDASGTSMLEKGPVMESPTRPGGSAWRHEISLVPSDPDSAYWTVPDWDTFYDYYVFSAGWKRVYAATSKKDLAPGDLRWVEFLAVSHLRIVLWTQSSRRLPDDIARITRDSLTDLFLSEWPRVREEQLGEAEELIDGLLLEDPSIGSIRDRDFHFWFEREFLFLASRLFAGEDLSQRLLSIWQARVDVRRRSSAIDRLAEQASRNLRGPTAEADLELLGRLDAGRAEQLTEVRARLLKAEADSHASLLNEIKRRGVSRRIVDSMAKTGTTPEVLVTLLASGVPTELIPRIVDAFPAARPEASEEDRLGED